MGTVNLIAAMAFSYAGKALAIGDPFTATDRDATLLKLTKRAHDAPRLRKTSRKDLTAEGVDLSNSDDMTAEVKIDRRTREYRRRDLVPEP